MEKNEILRYKESLYRVLTIKPGVAQVIDCKSQTMPKWVDIDELAGCETITDEIMLSETGIEVIAEDEASPEQLEQLRQCRERYTMIAGILCFLDDDMLRNQAIKRAVEGSGKSRRTIGSYLSRYLITGSILGLCDKTENDAVRELSKDQKNMRWALNKFYYTRHSNKLTDCYVMMLKEKYTDDSGQLLPDHPSIYQFRYFFNTSFQVLSSIFKARGS